MTPKRLRLIIKERSVLAAAMAYSQTLPIIGVVTAALILLHIPIDLVVFASLAMISAATYYAKWITRPFKDFTHRALCVLFKVSVVLCIGYAVIVLGKFLLT